MPVLEAFPNVAFVLYRLVAVNAEEDAFPSVLCPVTVRVPFEVKEEVAVIEPMVAEDPAREEIKAVEIFESVARRVPTVLVAETDKVVNVGVFVKV